MRRLLVLLVLCLASLTTEGRCEDLKPLIAKIKTVGSGGAGSIQAAEAWNELANLPANRLTDLLQELDDAEPLAANWIRTAVDAIAERQRRTGEPLPVEALELFVLNPAHAPRARRIAYEWLLQEIPSAKQRLLPQLLNDSSVELRYDAIAMAISRAEQIPASDKQGLTEAYETAFRASRDLEQVELIAKRLQELGKTVDLRRHFGFPADWKVVGPFDNVEGRGFDTMYPPENGIDFSASYQGKSSPAKWITDATKDRLGKVDLNSVLSEQKGVCAYAVAEFTSKEPHSAQIRVKTANAIKVWLNGRLVMDHNIYHSGTSFDQFVTAVELKTGKNRVMAKVCQNEQTDSWAKVWDFQLRVCDATGGGLVYGEN